ncbi:hypothetical protein Kpol_505p25 [Vanderwaltozyma polyspora DSM 70294]|uniref:Enoyl reductase (ER) domain-containing protein n=1 Tax=Vanderwaltozyma polyspora (strain ATCC 22028 / DSM 70294 / BCRC 21397 / CBS 2163 / NBRC 10782 / NRRL Y-8283 / UCD 57-17) TaxID=436907 RepID=A7TNB6_VANPO|nr:uncharacterized protein Kpol_505p25 [Vanderwaltozyma polyspora DSM 70294]EDO16248.1 hypothetical protein Kpol_505p25 [Vanderwaltozyma polyspora DSM 70294]
MSFIKKLAFWKNNSKKETKTTKAVDSKKTQETEQNSKTQEKMVAQTELPKTMKAVVIEGDNAVVKSDVPLPELEDGFALVKTIAVAANPTDWKHISYKIGPQGSIVGCDVAGRIVKLGPNVTDYAVGDLIYGFVHGSSVRFPTNGAFAEYVAVDTLTAYTPSKDIKLSDSDLPEGPVTSMEGAVTLPVSLTTAGVVLTLHFGNKMEWEPATPQHDFPLLIWGGATAIGQPLIQLAKKLNGYTKIIAVASKKHEATLKSYGADEVFDYHDEDVIDQIKAKYNNIQHLIDGVSNPQTLNQIYQCAADKEEATVMQLVTMDIETVEESLRRDNVKVTGTMLYLAAGKEVPFGTITMPANPGYRKAAVDFVNFINPKINDGEIRHIPVKVFKNGLEDIPTMLEDIKEGKNSGEKYVATFSN